MIVWRRAAGGLPRPACSNRPHLLRRRSRRLVDSPVTRYRWLATGSRASSIHTATQVCGTIRFASTARNPLGSSSVGELDPLTAY